MSRNELCSGVHPVQHLPSALQSSGSADGCCADGSAGIGKPQRFFFQEKLRKGTVELFRELHRRGFEVWIYTSSYRSESYIRNLFKLYGVKLDGIINAQRHNKEVQSGHTRIFPQKMPQRYHISLHIDDEENIIKSGRTFGCHAMRVYEPDDNWEEKVIEEAERVRRLEKLQKGQN